MSLQNINQSPKYVRHIVASRIFESYPLVVVDVGAREGFESHWQFYNDQVELIGFEPDVKECEKLNRRLSNSRKRFFPFALDEKKGRRTFYITAYPDSSGFYAPDMQFVQRFFDEANVRVEKTIEIDTIGFDSFARENNVEQVDFIKLDTEGSELDILKGAINTLKKSVLGLSIEVEFCRWHKGQPVFSDVDSFLRPIGFHLFDLSIYRHGRKSMRIPLSSPVPGGPTEYGQVIWGQALYLRDGAYEIVYTNMLGDGWNDKKIHKLAGLMELFCLPDCAIELIQVAHGKGFLKEVDVDALTALLAPEKDTGKHIMAAAKRGFTALMPRSAIMPVRNLMVKLRDTIDAALKI